MNSRHREERRNARKKMERFKINRETFRRCLKIRKKRGVLKNDETCLLDTYSTQKVTEHTKAIKFKR